MQFAGHRHRLIVHNIANLDTPNYRPVDVSVADFQKQLGQAVDERRAARGATGGELKLEGSQQVTFHDGSMQLHPEPTGENILFHDGNDRSVERIMQDLVENFMTFRTASEFIKSRFDLINSAIRERA